MVFFSLVRSLTPALGLPPLSLSCRDSHIHLPVVTENTHNVLFFKKPFSVQPKDICGDGNAHPQSAADRAGVAVLPPSAPLHSFHGKVCLDHGRTAHSRSSGFSPWQRPPGLRLGWVCTYLRTSLCTTRSF